MNPHRNSGPQTPTQIAQDLAYEIILAQEEILRTGRSPEKDLPKAVCTRIQRIGFFAMAGTRAILQDFSSAIDLVAWKASAATAVAIVFASGMADDRLNALDEFTPDLLIKNRPLIKIFVRIDEPGGLVIPSDEGACYHLGLAPESAASRTTRRDDDDNRPF